MEDRRSILSKYLNVEEKNIFVNNTIDKEYICDKKIYNILTDKELFDSIKSIFITNMDLPFTDYDKEEIISILSINVEEFDDFFLPDILIGKFDTKEILNQSISGKVLAHYLNNNNKLNYFVNNFIYKLIVDKSFWYLFQYKSYNKFEGFNILYVDDFPTLTDLEVDLIMDSWIDE